MTYGDTIRLSRSARSKLSKQPELIENGDILGTEYLDEFGDQDADKDSRNIVILAADSPRPANREEPACVLAILSFLMRQQNMVQFHSRDIVRYSRTTSPQAHWIWTPKTVGFIMGDLLRADESRVAAERAAQVSTARGENRRLIVTGRDDEGYWFRVTDWREGWAWLDCMWAVLKRIALINNQRIRSGDRRGIHTSMGLTLIAGQTATNWTLSEEYDFVTQVEAMFLPPIQRRNGRF